MRWIDVAGPPGVGKSTLTDELWPPRCIEWDEKPYPKEWDEFLGVTERLLRKIKGHPSINACRSMTQRSFRKMATISRVQDDRIYIQTGLVQRGLGIGWRLDDPEDIREYFEVMPLSIGVVVLTAPIEIVQRRNVERGKDRSFMVPLMERSKQIAIEVLNKRIPLVELDTTRPVHESKANLSTFSDHAEKVACSRTA